MGSQDNDISSNIANTSIPISNTSCNNLKSAEDLQCFVCDVKIQGRHYALATCRTQTSRSRVIEKLGELVGERYMVVISEDDVICRSCANLINTLDRLDVEMCNVRDNVLQFLEQKYSLDKGELLGSNEKTKRSQPPQITKCNNENVTSQGRRRDAAFSSQTTDRGKNKKSNVWMQCDKCRYTTLHNSYMIHHMRDHIKQKVYCDKCGIQFPETQQGQHSCNLMEQLGSSDITDKENTEVPMRDINDPKMDRPLLENTIQEIVPIMSIQTYAQSEISEQDESLPLIRLSNSENLQIGNILTCDNVSPVDQPLFVQVLQPIEINAQSPDSTMMASNSETELLVKLKDNSGKQILTLTEDGNLEMVDVACWNDVQPSESQSSITFQ